MKDLFEHYEELPAEVIAIIDKYCQEGDMSYQECRNMESEMKALGYTFEWYLDGTPFNLRKTEAPIIVEVRGGIAYCDDPRVKIIDFDNK